MRFKNVLTGAEIRVGFYKMTDGKPYLGTLPGMEVDIKVGETKELRDDSYPKVKVRVWKKEGIGLPIIIEPGTIYNMTDDFYVNWNSKKNHFLEKAELKPTPEKIEEENVKVYHFFDLRNFNENVKRTIKTTFQTAFSQSSSFSKSHSESSEFSINGKIGGWIGGKEDSAGGSAEISAGFKSKVEDSFTQKYESSITRTWGQSVEDEYNLKPGKIYVLTSVWNIKYATGTIEYFGEKTTYKILDSSESKLTEPVAYDDVSQMDNKTRKMYEEQLKLNTVL
ncbi:hypothetical protein C7448_10641 [Tenacibaculum gallaicum]|uniref:Uncharacterized protein n=1 Tax=Tenacibaculum gallaicum TaxID=561505 RepID=A0A3E0HM52_9FLAO|nr:hypothetical protein [Tenacibaculum gallaicum]REH47420.1 hypothetical protein C7448_10641 [Tenacibaculum gallaicum]